MPMTRSRLAALLVLALPLAAACTATETTPDATDSASAAPEATMTTPAPDATRTPEASEPPAASEPEADSCNASKVRPRWTGALPTDEVKAEIAKTVGERRIRYYTEGDPITMDYSEERLNVVLGKDGRIAEFSCG